MLVRRRPSGWLRKRRFARRGGNDAPSYNNTTAADRAPGQGAQAAPFEGTDDKPRDAVAPGAAVRGSGSSTSWCVLSPHARVRYASIGSVFGFEKRPATCPALLVFGKGRTCQTRPVGTNRPCACWERRSSSTEGVLHDGDTSCPSRRMLDTAGWRVRVLETKEFQCGGEGFMMETPSRPTWRMINP